MNKDATLIWFLFPLVVLMAAVWICTDGVDLAKKLWKNRVEAFPSCFKSRPGFQAQAENSCYDCPHQNECLL